MPGTGTLVELTCFLYVRFYVSFSSDKVPVRTILYVHFDLILLPKPASKPQLQLCPRTASNKMKIHLPKQREAQTPPAASVTRVVRGRAWFLAALTL